MTPSSGWVNSATDAKSAGTTPEELSSHSGFYIPVVASLHPLAHSLLHLIGWHGIAKDCVIDVFFEPLDYLWGCVILHISNRKRWNTRSYIRI